jgi:hypothetical protein
MFGTSSAAKRFGLPAQTTFAAERGK